jgi:hypothetical protein
MVVCLQVAPVHVELCRGCHGQAVGRLHKDKLVLVGGAQQVMSQHWPAMLDPPVHGARKVEGQDEADGL